MANNTKNIMIVGVGGQGTLLTSRILGGITVDAGFDVRNTADYLQEFYIDRTLRARHNEKNM